MGFWRLRNRDFVEFGKLCFWYGSPLQRSPPPNYEQSPGAYCGSSFLFFRRRPCGNKGFWEHGFWEQGFWEQGFFGARVLGTTISGARFFGNQGIGNNGFWNKENPTPEYQKTQKSIFKTLKPKPKTRKTKIRKPNPRKPKSSKPKTRMSEAQKVS